MIILTVFVDLVGFGIIIPLLPFYTASLGAGPTALGVLVASFSIMQFIFAPVMGGLSDRFGRRPIILVSLVGSFAGYLAFALADSLPMLFVSRITAGVASSNLSVAQAYIADTTQPKDRTRWMSLISAAFGVGFIVGPVIGGFLSIYGISAAGFGAAAIALTNLVLAFNLLPESLPRSHRGRGRLFSHSAVGILAAFRRPLVGALLTVFFVVSYAFSTIPVVYPLLGIRYFNLGPHDMAFIFTYIGILQVTVQTVLIGRLAKRIGEQKLLAIGVLLLTLTIFATPLIPNMMVFILLTGLLAVAVAITLPLVPSMVSRRSGTEEQGGMMGVTQSVGSLARVPGPLVAGFLFEHAGLAMPFYVSAALMLLAFILTVRISIRDRFPPSSE